MAMENDKLFVELEASQWIKTGQAACGDDFRCVRIPNEKRTEPCASSTGSPAASST